MVLVLHVIIALTSLAYTGYVFLSPTKTKLNVSYCLVGLTIASGTYLTLLNLSHMVSACVTGLIYLGFITLGLVLAHKRLVAQERV